MIFATPPHTPVQYAETAHEAPERTIRVPQGLSLDQFVFTYPNRLIALDGGKVLLRLRDDPVIELDSTSSQCTIVGWSLTIPFDQIHDISRLMGRRFLQLFGRSKSGLLTKQEDSDWTTLLGNAAGEERRWVCGSGSTAGCNPRWQLLICRGVGYLKGFEAF